ncbi:MAG: hypothetical protein ABI779_23775 [Acidobacteriota bacterium]
MNLETTLLICCAVLSLAAVVLLVFMLRRRRRETFEKTDAAQRLDLIIQMLEERVRSVNVLTSDELLPIATGLERLRGGIEGIARIVKIAVDAPPLTHDAVALEHEVLAQSWKQFHANQELNAALEDALQDRGWEPLIDRLSSVVPLELKPAFEAVMRPCREHRMLLQKISLIPRIGNGTLARLGTDAEEVRRTRELASLLTPEGNGHLAFRFRTWVTDTFLPFADLYLQRFQQAQLERGGDDLQAGATLVRQVLGLAAVEPIDVIPGETPFDSTRHVGRSTTNDPRFADGVITGVVRNGFVEGGQQVIRQPEVIVNRMR